MGKQIIEKFGILGEGCFLEDASIGTLLTETVYLNSLDILNLGTNPFILLQAPGKGKYYDIQKLTFIFQFGTSIYSLTDPYLRVYSIGGYNLAINKKIITDGQDTIIISGGYQTIIDTTNSVTVAQTIVKNSEVYLSTFFNNNPTTGDGTLTIKIQYTIEEI